MVDGKSLLCEAFCQPREIGQRFFLQVLFAMTPAGIIRSRRARKNRRWSNSVFSDAISAALLSVRPNISFGKSEPTIPWASLEGAASSKKIIVEISVFKLRPISSSHGFSRKENYRATLRALIMMLDFCRFKYLLH